MSNKRTAFGDMLREGRLDELRAMLADAIERHNGNVNRIAREFFVTRRQLYRYLHHVKLMDEVEQARTRRRMPEWLRKTKDALGA